MKKITLVVDEKWLEAINNLTNDVYEGETCTWLSIEDDLDIEKPCVYCEGVSDFVMIDGGWYVCTGCIKEGKTDTEGEA